MLQAVIVLLVVAGVAAVTLVQNEVAFRRQEGRRMLAIAEQVANNGVVELGLSEGSAQGVAGAAEFARSTSGATYVIATDARGKVIYSSYPADVGRSVTRPGTGRQWSGVSQHAGMRVVEARVPVLDPTSGGAPVGTVTGYVLVGREYPTTWARLGGAAPALLVYVVLASLVGMGGSILISRRIKRQTLGLEPNEIAGLVEHREAMLHGLREGVVGVDRAGRVTLVNDEAIRLLELGGDLIGVRVQELAVPPGLAAVLSGRTGADDLAVVSANGRVLVVNQLPVTVRDQEVGWVTTLRDRTELVDLNRQLDIWRGTTDALRSQAHEFSNRMHTIAGLIELEEYEQVATFVTTQSRAREGWVDQVTARVEDPAVAALLVAKDSRASELGITLGLDPGSQLPAVSDELSADLLTVVGNLVDNAMEAVDSGTGEVVVGLETVEASVVVTVRDDGPGVDPDLASRVFETGFSTKVHDEPGGRGWGLGLSRMVCERRGGTIGVRRDDEHDRTEFVAVLPMSPTKDTVETANERRDGR